MHTRYIPRKQEKKVIESLEAFPAVAILGPRQSGKSTLAKAIIGDKPDRLYLDLERPSDLRKLAEPELFFDLHEGSFLTKLSSQEGGDGRSPHSVYRIAKELGVTCASS
jgi:predicted AAA+ superfamily ATPase